MRILFLDFDGVLGPRMFDPEIRYRPDPNKNWEIEKDLHISAQEQIKRVINTTKCHVVISSAWRKSSHIAELVRFLIKAEVISDPNIVIGVTPETGRVRGDDIKKWIQSYNGKIDSFAIVDDSSDACCSGIELPSGLFSFSEDPELEDYFVQTNNNIGCTKDDADDLISILMKNKV